MKAGHPDIRELEIALAPLTPYLKSFSAPYGGPEKAVSMIAHGIESMSEKRIRVRDLGPRRRGQIHKDQITISRRLAPDERKVVAVHEVLHAIFSEGGEQEISLLAPLVAYALVRSAHDVREAKSAPAPSSQPPSVETDGFLSL